MKISRVRIRNFKSLKSVTLEGLKGGVVLAGPNGCGKSSIFDAIRLLKSAYGSYEQDEWQQWIGEFQITLRDTWRGLDVLFNDKKIPIEIEASFFFSQEELAYIKSNLSGIVEERYWIRHNRSRGHDARESMHRFSLEENGPHLRTITTETLQVAKEVEKFLSQPIQLANVVITPEGRITSTPNALLQLVFTVYDSENLGVFDFHGAHRQYNRERIATVNLALRGGDERQRQHSLYNYSNKYANVKTEMASAYTMHLIAKAKNPQLPSDDELTDSLKELFATFFPGKIFNGPQPTEEGKLLFPVQLPDGSEHDIDDLSSGEKEVLYGYLRLYTAGLKNSIILIDEPELHLNPRLIRGLAAFYYKHISALHGNQLWLVTHSDTIIREAISLEGFSVFHVQGSTPQSTAEQAALVSVDEHFDQLMVELVGDLATYKPHGKVVIFEGEEDVAFDRRVVSTLFPKFEHAVNSLSGGSKQRVQNLYKVLSSLESESRLRHKFYAVTDSDNVYQSEGQRHFSWDVYHIENYLLEGDFLFRVLERLRSCTIETGSAEKVRSCLKECAKISASALINHRLTVEVNSALLKSITFKISSVDGDPTRALAAAIQKASEKAAVLAAQTYPVSEIESRFRAVSLEVRSSLDNESWMKTFRGRDILKLFVTKYVSGISYQNLRELILSEMKDNGYQPAGMKAIVDRIMAD